jgi:PKD repeat protein
MVAGSTGTGSSIFSNTSAGGLPGRVLGYYTKWNQTIHYIESNNSAIGSSGWACKTYVSAQTGIAGYGGSGAAGGSGYGAGGGGGGPEQYGHTPIGRGGNGSSGFIYLEYSTPTIPVISISSNVTNGEAPLAIQFYDTSAGVPTMWEWDFGDNSSHSTQKNPQHLYTVGRSYIVTLTAGNSAGNATKSFGYFNVSDEPIANFSADPSTGPWPLIVTFVENSTGIPTAWYWNFDDGSYSLSGGLMNVSGYKVVYHTFNNSGTYNVSLSISNSLGSNVSQNMSIVVFDPSSVQWDKDIYSPGATGSLAYTIVDSYWDPAHYTYNIVVYDQSSTLKYTKSINTKSGTESIVFDTTNYPIGYYFGYVVRTKIEMGAATVALGTDTAHIAGIVTLDGYIKNAENGTLIDARVNMSQGDIVLNQTAISGLYNTTGTLFITSSPITFTLSAPNYRDYVVQFTPSAAQTYHLNLTMIPTNMIQYGSASIGGRVLDNPSNTPITGATVYVTNTTYSEGYTNVTNEWGYYRADNLVFERWYDVYSTKSGFKTSDHKLVQAL